jgi:hypothetical protein
MSEIFDSLQSLQVIRDKAELAEFTEAIRIASNFADKPTTLFDVWNSKLNHYFVWQAKSPMR